MKALALFAAALVAGGLTASAASAQPAAPVVFSLAVAGLSRAEVEASVQTQARSACHQAYRNFDLSNELDAVGYEMCVQNTVTQALAQAAPALAVGAPIRFTIKPQEEERP